MTTTPFLSDFDLHLLGEGTHYRTYEKLGAHLKTVDGTLGTHFAVWAPNARLVSVIGDFNEWKADAHPMTVRNGIWEVFIPGVQQGAIYKYAIRSNVNDHYVEKADPHAFFSEIRPQTASKVWDIDTYAWQDAEWMAKRAKINAIEAPVNIYEVHLGSWKRVPARDNAWMTYAEMAAELPAYVAEMGYTHVELLPLAEHPFDGSWGYQTVGYFSPTSRFGTPQDLMALVDAFHAHGVGVILDWVPAHFPKDEHGLGFFDGTHLYEHADPRQGTHTDWGTFIFNYGRREVSNFLISNALFWLDKYHIDGLRVDAVASMLYLDYGRQGGEWVPNQHGGRENLEAIDFLRRFNERVSVEYPGTFTIAEESTSWPMVSRPPYVGGLGFHMKWNMGWMHDMLRYMSQDPIYRAYAHNSLTFSMMYQYSENFVLPFSHDEVVHLKKSMLDKMPGDTWQKFANLRLLYGYMTGHPGKKLLFMGQEFGQWREWNHDFSLDWHLIDEDPKHGQLQHWVRDLNRLYRDEPAMHAGDAFEWGFRWVDCDDNLTSVVSFVRLSEDQNEAFLFICNYTPVPRNDYRIGLPWPGEWQEVLNSDATVYGGSGLGNMGARTSDAVPWHRFEHSAAFTLPPLAALVFRSKRPPAAEPAAIEPAAETASGPEPAPAASGPDRLMPNAAIAPIEPPTDV